MTLPKNVSELIWMIATTYCSPRTLNWIVTIVIIVLALSGVLGLVLGHLRSIAQTKRDNRYADIIAGSAEVSNKFSELQVSFRALLKEYDQLRTTVLKCLAFLSQLKALPAAVPEVGLILLSTIVEALREDVKTKAGEMHRCAIWSPNDNQCLGILTASGFRPEHLSRTLPLTKSIAATVYRTGEPRMTGDVTKEPDYTKFVEKPAYSSLVCVPVSIMNGEVWGVLTVDAIEKDAFSFQDTALAQLYAELAGCSLVILAMGGVPTAQLAGPDTEDNGGPEGAS